ncbi:Uncharacterised protein [Chlamydia trachomatis]|nr:Uncharacterised protein [Chlamydia trachomatis]
MPRVQAHVRAVRQYTTVLDRKDLRNLSRLQREAARFSTDSGGSACQTHYLRKEVSA